METNQRSWLGLWMPCNETASRGCYSANGITTRTAAVPGEILTGATSSVTIQCVAPHITIGGYDTLIYRPISGGTLTAGEILSGSIAADITLYPGGLYDALETPSDSTGNIHFPGLNGATATLFDFATFTDGIGCGVSARQGLEIYSRYAMPDLGTNDFILQVVTLNVVNPGNFEFRIGGVPNDSFVQITDTKFCCGNTLTQAIGGGHINQVPYDGTTITNRCLVRRGLQIAAIEEDDWANNNGVRWQDLPLNVDITLTKNMSMAIEGTLGNTSKCFGFLLAIFPNGLPSEDDVLAGALEHRNNWSTGTKTLTTKWGR